MGEKNGADVVLKQAAADAAVEQLQNGMIVGLGSGSTALLAVTSIGKRVAEGLRITGIPTSRKTADHALSLNIPLSTLEDHPEIDVTIDGADQVEVATLNLIKGGGGNQLREKIVAMASERLVIVVHEDKVVRQLGVGWPLAVEVIRFGCETTAKRLQRIGATPRLRMSPDGAVYVTDDGNYIVDCDFGPIASAVELQRELDSIVGVVEHGLFIGIAAEAIVAGKGGVKALTRE